MVVEIKSNEGAAAKIVHVDKLKLYQGEDPPLWTRSSRDPLNDIINQGEQIDNSTEMIAEPPIIPRRVHEEGWVPQERITRAGRSTTVPRRYLTPSLQEEPHSSTTTVRIHQESEEHLDNLPSSDTAPNLDNLSPIMDIVPNSDTLTPISDIVPNLDNLIPNSDNLDPNSDIIPNSDNLAPNSDNSVPNSDIVPKSDTSVPISDISPVTNAEA